MMGYERYKAFVTGPYQAGKTHLIHALDPNAISIERPIRRGNGNGGGTTTTCFDLGRVVWLSDGRQELLVPRSEYQTRKDEFEGWKVREVELRGVPGSLQFRSVRDAMRNGTDVVLFVVDSSDPSMVSDAKKIMDETRAAHNGTHIQVVASKQDANNAAPPEEVARWLGVDDAIGFSVTDVDLCKRIIIDTLRKIEKDGG